MKTYKTKKSLGQNFLKSVPALNKIIEAGEISSENIILEIGPGKGALTKKLLEKVCPAGAGQGLVIAVEKDRELFEFLKIKFEKEIGEHILVLVNDDILKFDINSISLNFFSLRTAKRNSLLEKIKEIPINKAVLTFSNSNVAKQDILRKSAELGNYKVIANIPYNITGAILKKFLTTENQPTSMALMVQKEVAERIIARDGKESLLSISVKAYGEPKMIMKVPARYFSPAPEVDSAIISIKNISRKIFEKNKIGEEKFWKIVRAGFAHKRKKLSGNLKSVIPREKLYKLGLKDKRAEDLGLKDWLALAK
ncbi:hypothetical protein A3A01_01765 [Candidatus Nomurabacteria bacterium RIFCSPLOWO2_01_FULL_39_17]|uniref:Ribosomal RNA small subunit methyltransferase A n=1 Tax=Candidatus Nomurabacteria bacterium RIFCSPLOWO2_01_FULL_39_17 TaxID=1801770 RepID=A0A1F6WUU8_9BACT|nr:MAG: hypothetical protein A3A01_01765 [Candidatus Nomurabacteria bacterium RIFCSPLOWO2_01_FULL_39_17]